MYNFLLSKNDDFNTYISSNIYFSFFLIRKVSQKKEQF
jgi:hypothetical protein